MLHYILLYKVRILCMWHFRRYFKRRTNYLAVTEKRESLSRFKNPVECTFNLTALCFGLLFQKRAFCVSGI